MSILQHPDTINSQNLQIWNNAAFDAASEGSGGLPERVSWFPLQPISTNQSLDVDSDKENRSRGFPNSPVSKKSQAPIKPSHQKSDPRKLSAVPCKHEGEADNGDLDDRKIDAEIKEIEREISHLSSRLEALLVKKAGRESRAAADGRRGRIVPAKFMDPKQSSMKDFATPDARKVKESPASLKSRQRGLSCGPFGAGAGLKQNLGKKFETPALRKTEESPASVKLHRRGASLGPMDIHNGITFQKPEAPESTPLGSAKSRRKSCFWKLEGIEEEKGMSQERERRLCSSPKSRPSIAKAPEARRGIAEDRSKKVVESPSDPASVRFRRRGVSLGPSEIATSTRFRQPGKLHQIKETVVKQEKGRSLSASPKSRQRSLSKLTDLRKGIATAGVKKSVKGEERSLAGLKPKVLFQEAKNPVPSKRPSKSTKVRVVASRYSLASARVSGDEPENKRRKWSLPEPGKEETNRGENKCSLSLGDAPVSMLESSRTPGSDDQMKREWEISIEAEGEESLSLPTESSPPSLMKIAGLLPKIRTFRCTAESPRDSGCAKRVAELVGRRSYFGAAEGEASTSPCMTLMFEEEEQ